MSEQPRQQQPPKPPSYTPSKNRNLDSVSSEMRRVHNIVVTLQREYNYFSTKDIPPLQASDDEVQVAGPSKAAAKKAPVAKIDVEMADATPLKTVIQGKDVPMPGLEAKSAYLSSDVEMTDADVADLIVKPVKKVSTAKRAAASTDAPKKKVKGEMRIRADGYPKLPPLYEVYQHACIAGERDLSGVPDGTILNKVAYSWRIAKPDEYRRSTDDLTELYKDNCKQLNLEPLKEDLELIEHQYGEFCAGKHRSQLERARKEKSAKEKEAKALLEAAANADPAQVATDAQVSEKPAAAAKIVKANKKAIVASVVAEKDAASPLSDVAKVSEPAPTLASSIPSASTAVVAVATPATVKPKETLKSYSAKIKAKAASKKVDAATTPVSDASVAPVAAASISAPVAALTTDAFTAPSSSSSTGAPLSHEEILELAKEQVEKLFKEGSSVEQADAAKIVAEIAEEALQQVARSCETVATQSESTENIASVANVTEEVSALVDTEKVSEKVTVPNAAEIPAKPLTDEEKREYKENLRRQKMEEKKAARAAMSAEDKAALKAERAAKKAQKAAQDLKKVQAEAQA